MNFKRKITKTEWLEMNGFSEYGVTYLVLGNSYPIKDDLKENGFKFSPLLRWHGDTNDFDLPEGCYYKEFCFDEVFIWNEEDHHCNADPFSCILRFVIKDDSGSLGTVPLQHDHASDSLSFSQKHVPDAGLCFRNPDLRTVYRLSPCFIRNDP